MSLRRKQEYGVELSAWNAGDPVAGVPIKKRRFLFRRSPSPPPSHSTVAGADNCDPQMKEAPFPAADSSASGVSAQAPDIDCTDFRDSSLDCIAKVISGRQVILGENCASFPSSSEGLLSTVSVTAATEFGNRGKAIFENRPAVGPIPGTVPETIEFRSTLGDGSLGNKLILSDKSAFQRVLENTELPLPLNRRSEPSLGEPPALVSAASDGQPSSFNLELTLSESHTSSRSKPIDSGLGSSHDNQNSSRSHWDLNTTMDTWERSIVETTLDHGEGGDNKVDLGSIHCKRPETELVDKSLQESTGIHVMHRRCELSESTCNLKLPTTLKSASEKSAINTDLNLQLNTDFGSMPFSKVGVPFAPSTPSLHKALDSSLPAVRPIALTHLKLAVCGDVKAEPVDDGGNGGKNTGASNCKSVNQSIIKSEALDLVEQGGVKLMCRNGAITPCGGAVKLEQMEVPCVEGPQKVEGKAHDPECCLDTQETVKAGDMHHGKEGSVAWSLNLVTQGIVDFDKMHGTLRTPNVDAFLAMGESLSEVTPVVGARTLVLNDTKLDLSQGMPSNAEQPHGASPTIDSSVSSESVVSDVNNSHNAHSTPMHVVPQDDGENTIKASEVSSETTTMLCNEPSQAKGSSEVVSSTSDVLLYSENKEQRDVNCIQENTKQTSYSDNGAQLPAFISMDVRTLHPPNDSKVTETDAGGEIKEPELCKIKNEPCGSHEAAGVKERVPKQHSDDDDHEDGEFRESLLRGDAIKGNDKEKKDVNTKEVVKSVAPLNISSPVTENESNLQNIDESKDVHCTVDSEIRLCPEKTEDDLNMTKYLKESSAIEKPITESGKKKSVRINRKMPQELGKEYSESKSTHKITLSSSHGKSPDNIGADFGSQQPKSPADQSGPSKICASRTCDATKHVKGRSDRSHITLLSSPSNASTGRIKSSQSRSSSWSERERINDQSVRCEKVPMKSSRNESHLRRMHESEKEDLDQALRKGGSDRVHMRGRIVRQFDSHHGNWDLDHGYASEHFNISTSSRHSTPKNVSEVAFTVGMDDMFESAGRTGKKHVDDEVCRPPPRRPSPGGSGPLPVGVQMVLRKMRDISPGRCAEEGIPELVMLNREGKLMRGFADDTVNSSLLLRTRPNYEPGRNCLIRRERSVSPFERRAAPHVSNISFASSTRPRARSPHMWSPSRRPPDFFDGHPDLIRCRSPDLRVERVRSPGERACFQENMLGRRHISPHMAQLRGEMPDVNLMRGHDLPKPGRHPQGNLRRFDLIEHHVNPDNFGDLQPGQFRGIEGDMYAEERTSDEGHGLARPFRQQHYIVGDDVANDGAFHHHVEDIPPRPIRLCQDADEEFPGRGISRVGSIRNRLGNVHNRRPRGMDEQEDNYRQDNGQGWHGASFKDVRIKRRIF